MDVFPELRKSGRACLKRVPETVFRYAAPVNDLQNISIDYFFPDGFLIFFFT